MRRGQASARVHFWTVRSAIGGEGRSLLGCDQVREALSARMDGEDAGVPAATLSAHLDACPQCGAFEAGSAGLGRNLALRAPVPVPPGLVVSLVPLVERRPPVRLAALRPRLWGAARGPLPERSYRWAAAALPAVIAVAALCLGTGPRPGSVPTRPVTACTAGLVRRGLDGQRPPGFPASHNFFVTPRTGG
jgi:predicted anti-sigma-YlaC factor YlaD